MSRRDRESALLTMLFTDIVGSTEIAGEMGDRRWRELLRRHNEVVRRELQRFGGREIDTAGDGFFATFDRPAQAIRAAWAISDGVRRLGIEVRAGLHLGEAEVIGPSVSGVAVHVGARVASSAGAGEVLVSETLKAVVPGSGFRFEDRGVHQLKGVPEPHRLLAVAAVVGADRSPPLETEEAARRRELIEAAAPVYRRRTPLASAAALVVLGSVVALVLALRDGGPSPPAPTGTPPVTHDLLVRIDELTGEVVARIGPVPSRTSRFNQHPFSDVVAGEGSVWIDNGHSGSVSQVDPDSNEVVRSIPLGFIVEGVAVTGGVEGAVWVARRGGHQQVMRGAPSVARISAATGEEVARVGLPFPGEVSFSEISVAADEEGVWAAFASEEVFRIDPRTNELDGSITFGSEVGGALAVGEGSVWAGAGLEDVVYRADPATESFVEIEVPGGVSALAVGDGAVWGLNTLDGTLVRIDPDENRIVETIPVGDSPVGLAVGAGAVWVSDSDRGSVFRINPATREKLEIPVGGIPEGMALLDGSAWVVVRVD